METFWDKVEVGDNVRSIIRDDNCVYLSMRNETGEGSMTCYDIFPGIVFMYCDYHMEYCESRFQSKGDLFCIDYCMEGSFENEISPGVFAYLRQNELSLNTREHHSGGFLFPQRHFHGITICFSVPEADQALQELFKGAAIRVAELKKRFCSNTDAYVIKAPEQIQKFFDSLMDIPGNFQLDYMRVKVLELLLELHTLQNQDYKREIAYIFKAEAEKLKAIRKMMIEDIRHFYTIEELSHMFEISQTALKSGFKTLYGAPVYSYMKNYRMNLAASMLIDDSKKNISEVASFVGYDNASKFSAAFSKVMGMTPVQYRKTVL